MDIDQLARQAAQDTPQEVLPVSLAGVMFGGWGHKDIQDPRLEDADWMPPEGFCKPLNWRVLLMPRKMKMVSEAGIHLDPASYGEDVYCYVGRIVARGALCQKSVDTKGDEVELARGQWVIYASNAGTKVQWRNIKLVLLNDDNIDGVIEEPKDWMVYL